MVACKRIGMVEINEIALSLDPIHIRQAVVERVPVVAKVRWKLHCNRGVVQKLFFLLDFLTLKVKESHPLCARKFTQFRHGCVRFSPIDAARLIAGEDVFQFGGGHRATP